MIDEAVEKLAKNFVEKFNVLGEKVKDYNFDFSFYSTNLLDLVLDTRFTNQLDKKFKEELILESAAYLGFCIYGIWENLTPSPEISIILKEHPQTSIILSLKSEVFQAPAPVSFNLTNIINDALLATSQNYFPTRDSIIKAGEENRAISHAAFGVVTGMSSHAEGPWKFKNEAELSIFINQVSLLLGDEKTDKLNFLNSSKIDKSIIYPNLTIPPLGYKEAIVGRRVTSFILDKDLNTECKALLKSCFKRSDFMLASAGYLHITSEDSINNIYSAKDFSLVYPLWASGLRPMFQALRESKGFISWLKAATESKFDEALLELRIESEYGLTPLINTPSLIDVLNPRNLLYFEALASGLISEGYILGRKLTMKKTVTDNVIFNQAFICYKLRKAEEALALLERINDKEILKIKLELLIKKDYENLDEKLLERILISYNPNCWQFEAEFLITTTKIILSSEELKNNFAEITIKSCKSSAVLAYSTELNFTIGENLKVNSWSPYSFWNTARLI